MRSLRSVAGEPPSDQRLPGNGLTGRYLRPVLTSIPRRGMPQSYGFRVVGDNETEPLPDTSLDILFTGGDSTYDIEFHANRQLHRERFFQLGL